MQGLRTITKMVDGVGTVVLMSELHRGDTFHMHENGEEIGAGWVAESDPYLLEENQVWAIKAHPVE